VERRREADRGGFPPAGCQAGRRAAGLVALARGPPVRRSPDRRLWARRAFAARGGPADRRRERGEPPSHPGDVRPTL